MGTNIIRYVLIFNSLIISSLGLLINFMEPSLPTWLSRLYRYGKVCSTAHHSAIAKLEVPKKWFGHYYILCLPILVVWLYLALSRYFFDANIPEILFSILDTLLGASRKPLVSAESTLLAVALMYIHMWKRMYETYFVNVFSGKKINLTHYVLGYMHYLTTLFCLIGESEGFVRDSHAYFSLHQLTLTQLICTLLFLWATYTQLQSNYIFMQLRMNRRGDVVTKDYKIPYGGMFTYISNPLQFTEILVYMMLSGILWRASTYHYVTIFVIVNQVQTAYFYDTWFRKTFKNYPKERKILIPYVW